MQNEPEPPQEGEVLGPEETDAGGLRHIRLRFDAGKDTRRPAANAARLLGRVVQDALREQETVELEGLGFLVARPGDQIRFFADMTTRVFIAYAFEDAAAAVRLEHDLAAAGFSPWLDRNKLLPGQRWQKSIERAIETTDIFVPCYSPVSAAKRGYFPYEVRYALRCAGRLPLDDSFIFPVRLDRCAIPRRLGEYQYVDLFPDWDYGFARLVAAIHAEMHARRERKRAA